MAGFPLHRFAEFASLSETQRRGLQALAAAPRRYARRSAIRHEGASSTCVWLLHEGWVGAAIDLRGAKRQLVKIHLPGDVLGSTSMCLTRAGDTLEVLSDAVVSAVPYEVLGRLFVDDPRLGVAFLLRVQKERLALMHKLAEIGRVSAYERVAGLMFDLMVRGREAGIVADNVIECPLTQEQIADLLGLTNVHVNRMIRRLNQEGLVEGTHTRFLVRDEARLSALVPLHARFTYNPSWLPAHRAGIA